MRVFILVAGAALAVSACSSNEAANNTMNVEENLMSDSMMANDTTAIDAATGADANMAEDANMSMNLDDNMAHDMNAMGNDVTSNNAM